jgi:hypothetical protein
MIFVTEVNRSGGTLATEPPAIYTTEWLHGATPGVIRKAANAMANERTKENPMCKMIKSVWAYFIKKASFGMAALIAVVNIYAIYEKTPIQLIGPSVQINVGKDAIAGGGKP